MKIAIIVSKFNKPISDHLLKGALKALKDDGVKKNEFAVFEVPGAFEIPFLAAKLINSKKFNGLIALGCILRGETEHYRAICDGVTYGLQKVAIENRIPIMFGVLMCRNMKQALVRSGNDVKNKGYECTKGLLKILGGRW